MKKYKVITENWNTSGKSQYNNAVEAASKNFERRLNEASEEGYVVEHYAHKVGELDFTFVAVMSKEGK